MLTNGKHYKESIRNCAIQHEYKFIEVLNEKFDFYNKSSEQENEVVAFLDWCNAEYKSPPIELTIKEKNFLEDLLVKYEHMAIYVDENGRRLIYFFRLKPRLHFGAEFVCELNEGEYFLLNDYLKDYYFYGLVKNVLYCVKDILADCKVVY